MQEYKIKMKTPKREDVFSVRIVLENCDEVEFFQNEIEEMELAFEPELEFVWDGIVRKLKSGFFKIVFQEKYNKYREPLLALPARRKRPKNDELIERLKGTCDVTWLLVVDEERRRELIEVPYEELIDEETGDYKGLLVCSSAELDADGKLLIFMGDKSKYSPK